MRRVAGRGASFGCLVLNVGLLWYLVAAGESRPAVDGTEPDTRRKIWHTSRAGRILVDNRQEHGAMIRSTLRAAFRQLQQDAGYAIAFILTLGLGIGASTAIFSAVEGVLIRPLPVPARRSHRLHAAAALGAPATRTRRSRSSRPPTTASRPTTIEEVVEYGDWQFNVVGLGEPRVAYGGLVTSNYFQRARDPAVPRPRAPAGGRRPQRETGGGADVRVLAARRRAPIGRSSARRSS